MRVGRWAGCGGGIIRLWRGGVHKMVAVVVAVVVAVAVVVVVAAAAAGTATVAVVVVPTVSSYPRPAMQP